MSKHGIISALRTAFSVNNSLDTFDEEQNKRHPFLVTNFDYCNADFTNSVHFVLVSCYCNCVTPDEVLMYVQQTVQQLKFIDIFEVFTQVNFVCQDI